MDKRQCLVDGCMLSAEGGSDNSFLQSSILLTGSGWKQRCLLRLVMIIRPVPLLPLQTEKGVQIQQQW